MISFTINKESKSVDVDGDTPLLWVIRDELDLKGTKFGCGKAACGACTIHIGDMAVRSCSYPVKLAEGKEITTIEGLGEDGELHPVQQAWKEHVVPRYGWEYVDRDALETTARDGCYHARDDAQQSSRENGCAIRCLEYGRCYVFCG